jgi:hypothetical protein
MNYPKYRDGNTLTTDYHSLTAIEAEELLLYIEDFYLTSMCRFKKVKFPCRIDKPLQKFLNGLTLGRDTNLMYFKGPLEGQKRHHVHG